MNTNREHLEYIKSEIKTIDENFSEGEEVIAIALLLRLNAFYHINWLIEMTEKYLDGE